jgi:hypothetical protein
MCPVLKNICLVCLLYTQYNRPPLKYNDNHIVMAILFWLAEIFKIHIDGILENACVL